MVILSGTHEQEATGAREASRRGLVEGMMQGMRNFFQNGDNGVLRQLYGANDDDANEDVPRDQDWDSDSEVDVDQNTRLNEQGNNSGNNR